MPDCRSDVSSPEDWSQLTKITENCYLTTLCEQNVETVSGNMYITLQNKDDYRNMASLESTRKLYTALETAEHCSTLLALLVHALRSN